MKTRTKVLAITSALLVGVASMVNTPILSDTVPMLMGTYTAKAAEDDAARAAHIAQLVETYETALADEEKAARREAREAELHEQKIDERGKIADAAKAAQAEEEQVIDAAAEEAKAAALSAMQDAADSAEKITARLEAERIEAERKAAWEAKKANFRIDLTEGEYDSLLRIVQAEAGNTDERSKMLVADVVINRRFNSAFPNNITEVCEMKLGSVYQFSTARPGSTYWTCTVTDATRAAVDKALTQKDISNGALYFLNKRYSNPTYVRWFETRLTWVTYYAGHDYYK